VCALRRAVASAWRAQSILPFTGLNNPTGIAVDGQGDVYVVDSGNNRVLKLEKSFRRAVTALGQGN
jgi:DNA-binding beta-propeller fold protein YncE